ncbi:MAG TPA: hypothetical protein VJG90_00735 [Candidatus Nanoarchaeia archaeon]|nr:hypothetical protein [Candidatus Nanoarchaeia archaeon]
MSSSSDILRALYFFMLILTLSKPLMDTEAICGSGGDRMQLTLDKMSKYIILIAGTVP